MGKVSLLIGFGAGYVLGAKGGRGRYEQIKCGTSKVWHTPGVHTTVTDMSSKVKDKAPAAAGSAFDAVKSRVGGEDLPAGAHRGTDGRLHGDTSGYGPGGDRLP
jgi:hypothetical protein